MAERCIASVTGVQYKDAMFPARLFPLRARHGAALWGVVVLLVMGVFYRSVFFSEVRAGSNDPDRYYHLALARLSSEHGLPRSLPQVEDLGWGKYFPDKEFLFHVLTRLGYELDGERGVLGVIAVLGTAIVLVLYGALVPVIPPWKAALLALVAVLVSGGFFYRLLLLRPHVLAIFFFCLLLWSVLQRHRVLGVLSVLGFVLAYHAFYVPLIALALAWPLRRTAARPAGLWLGWMSLALLAGLVLNPYFPSNVVMAFTHVQIALGAGLPPDRDPGIEVRALPFAEFLRLYGYLLAGALAVLASYLAGLYRGGARPAEYRYLLQVTLCFTALAIGSPRAVEYAIPALILLVGYTLHHFSSARAMLAACLLFAGLQWQNTRDTYVRMFTTDLAQHSRIYLELLDTLPPAAAGKKVFNCEWALSPYVFYARPQLRFVDILDPALLWLRDPQKYLVRQRLIAGQSPQPATDLREVFDADFVFCTHEALVAQLRADPDNFASIAETRTLPPVVLFEVRR